MATFPTLSSGKWEIGGLANTRAFNPIKEAPFSAGYGQRIKRATWTPKQFQRNIRVMSAADVASIETFMTAINDGQDWFAWLDTLSSNSYQVWFDMRSLPLKYELDGRNDLYRTSVVFNQYNDSETTSGEAGWGVCGVGLCGV